MKTYIVLSIMLIISISIIFLRTKSYNQVISPNAYILPTAQPPVGSYSDTYGYQPVFNNNTGYGSGGYYP